MPKSQKEINTNLLVAIYQNLQTAKQSINNVIEKIKDSKLKKELKKQYRRPTRDSNWNVLPIFDTTSPHVAQR